MIGSLICFKVADFLGRRRELLIAALLFLAGALVEAWSGSSSWSGDWGLVILMIGRVSYGIGCGFAMHGVSRMLCFHRSTKTLFIFYIFFITSLNGRALPMATPSKLLRPFYARRLQVAATRKGSSAKQLRKQSLLQHKQLLHCRIL